MENEKLYANFVCSNGGAMPWLHGAGGPLYPADLDSVKVIRPEKNGTKSVATVDLGDIKTGDAEDIRLKGGDIVEVTATDSKLVGYGMYKMFTTMVNVSAGIPIF